MTTNQPQSGRKFSLAGALWIAAIAALIGFGAVYLIAQGPDNAAVSVPAGGKAESDGKDELAAFVTKDPRDPLPAFTFQDASGNDITLDAFKGKTILVNLWATWCGPCKLEMPSLDRLQASLGSDKFEVVAISLDKDGKEKAKKFFGDTKISHLNFYIDPTGREAFNLMPVGLPTTYLIDEQGLEIGRLAGPAEWDSEAAKALISKAIK